MIPFFHSSNYYRKEHVFWHGIRSLIIFLASNYLTGSQTRSPGLNIDQFFFGDVSGLNQRLTVPVDGGQGIVVVGDKNKLVDKAKN